MRNNEPGAFQKAEPAQQADEVGGDVNKKNESARQPADSVRWVNCVLSSLADVLTGPGKQILDHRMPNVS